ncbi:MAG: fibronectin type III domain-containing protein, partial [Candidatus Omnitrophica bacterium]|nr:fibronectin type III domain-containing protein [Candidatus Omnitrophota bacterium]
MNLKVNSITLKTLFFLTSFYIFLSQSPILYAQETAKITSPPPNTLLSSSTITFQWTQGQNITEYYLGVGTTFNSISNKPWGNIFAGTVSTTSKNISNIPLNGQKIFVRIWSKINNTWLFEDYNYPTEAISNKPAEIITPTPNTTLNQQEITFQWSAGLGVTNYYLGVGTNFNSVSQSPWGNIFAGTVTGTSKSISTIPLTGEPLFVRLWSKIAGSWQFIDYTYQTEKQSGGAETEPAELISPPFNTLIQNSTITFEWSQGKAVTQFYCGVGTSFHSVSQSPWGNIFAGTVTGTSKSISNIPLNGQKVFVRMWSKINNVWQSKDYSFDTERQTQNDEPAQMTIPAPDSILNESSISFQWTQGVNVSEYYLGVGTSFNSVSQSPWGNIFAGTVTGTSKSISGIILNGKPVFVRLWSKINSQWKFIDYTYQTENQGQTESPAEITTPAPGSTFSESIVTFQWTPGNNVTSYYLGVGKSFNSVSKSPWGNIFAGTINGTSKTVPNIPLSGESIFVRLWSKINGVWLTRDYTYNTLLDDSIPPSAPTNLTVTNITSTSMQINWKAATDNFTVAGYRLDAARDQNFTQFVPGFQNKDIANTLNHIITNLTSNTPYFIRLRAYDQAGNLSVNSTVISATTHSSGGPTTVDSNITVDTIWTADGSPYIIKNNIVVNSVSVLTIQPGTVIRFDGNFFLKVSGQMIAEGTATQPIVFTSNKTTPAISNWQYLELNNLSRIKNARIEYADSGLFTNNSGIVIENVISEHNRVGFFIQGGTTSLSNITARNNVEGIHLSKGTLAQITQSTITTNQDGIFIDLDETGTNKNNTPNIIQNKIFNNINFNIKTKAASAAFSHQNKKINAKNNWWGTSNINEVEQKIFDDTDAQ